jgi:LysR family transcriptional regulator, hydrogen peroxide-inducible genes activator
MNIQQFQYIITLAELRHFEQAAEKCFVTQSTLSTMISKFEEEISIQLFDRKKKPVKLTKEGLVVVEQLKQIVKEIDNLQMVVNELKGIESGKLSIAVIPTIAPFLLPHFLSEFANSFAKLDIHVSEQTTSEIIRQLKSRDLDIAIVSIPIVDKDLIEIKLYDEPFVYYDSMFHKESLVTTNDLDVSKLCLLEEGHCMRTQMLELCDFHKKQLKNMLNFRYKAGSIDSLLRFVKANDATTLLPYLSIIGMADSDLDKIRYFTNPVPYRSVGIVVHRNFVREKVLQALKEKIQSKISPLIPQNLESGKMLMPLKD